MPGNVPERAASAGEAVVRRADGPATEDAGSEPPLARETDHGEANEKQRNAARAWNGRPQDQ